MIEGREDTPHILLDMTDSIFRIVGASYPEDAFAVYSPVIEWIEKNRENITVTWTCEFEFTYLSSASNKMIYEILLKFEELSQSGKDIRVKWLYKDFDEDMLEVGETYAETFSLPFQFIVN